MKKIFYLKKTSRFFVNINTDPNYYLGREYVFDNFYTIKPVSISRDAFVVHLEVDGLSQISRISIRDFLNHVRKGNMVEKPDVERNEFRSFSDYYTAASSFLLINYGSSIDSILFDWEREFERRTPVEIACKIALGIIKK